MSDEFNDVFSDYMMRESIIAPSSFINALIIPATLRRMADGRMAGFCF